MHARISSYDTPRRNVTSSLMGDPPRPQPAPPAAKKPADVKGLPRNAVPLVRTPAPVEEDAPEVEAVAPKAADFGPKPNMCWLPKKSLKIDRRYQREIKSRRSVNLIKRLSENWRWYHCAPLTVVENGDGTYNVIDGQHRLAAARLLDGITLVPAYVVDALTLEEQASAFVAHNSDRVAVSQHQIFHAKAVGGDEEAMGILKACEAAGVIVQRSAGGSKRAHETGSLGALREIYRADGPGTLTRVLATLREGYPDIPNQLTSHMIYAVWRAIKAGKDVQAVTVALAGTDDNTLRIEARFAALSDASVKLREAYAAALLKLVGSQVEEGRE